MRHTAVWEGSTIERDAFHVIGITGRRMVWRYVTGVQRIRAMDEAGCDPGPVIAEAVCVDREGAVER